MSGVLGRDFLEDYGDAQGIGAMLREVWLGDTIRAVCKAARGFGLFPGWRKVQGPSTHSQDWQNYQEG